MEEKKNKFLIKSYKQMFLVIGIFTLVLLVGGTTYAFFNYTRTGPANTLNTGRIYFSTEQTNQNTITLNNIFPMTKEQALADTSTNGTLVVTFTGDTTYSEGIEYLLTIDEVTRTANVPISLIMDVNITENNVALTENVDYYTARNSKDTSMYKAEGTDTVINNTNHKIITDIETGKYLLAGYIKSGTDVVNGTVTIKAFIDADNLLITDTPNDQSNAPTGYTDGTVTTGKTVISTTDWNSLQSTGVSFKVKGEAKPGIWVKEPLTAVGQIIKEVNTTTQINFGNKSSDTNGKGLYILPGTERDVNPIYYYRGAVTNNNVIFGGFCWQIVRTTNTGGIKMIYNGVATGDGKTCENTTGASRQLASTSAFNTNIDSMSDVGYMYNQRYAYNSSGWTTNALFGNTATWVTDHYELTDASVTTPDTTHHYSCNATTSDATCTSLRYVYYVNGTSKYYITLTNGDTIEDALYKMTGTGSTTTKAKNASYVLNRTDSKAKTEIENWFKTNLTNEEDASKTNYQEYLEDTIYCNDRSYKETGSSNTYNQSGWNPNGGSLSTYLYFGTWNRFNNSNWYSTINIPSMECENVTDRFSVSNQEAKLKYPVGLLTADEIILAGAAGNSTTSNTSYYLYTGNYYWSLSTDNFSSNNAGEFLVNSYGNLINYCVNSTIGLRPVVSLKLGTEFEDGGDGTSTKPYVVKTSS